MIRKIWDKNVSCKRARQRVLWIREQEKVTAHSQPILDFGLNPQPVLRSKMRLHTGWHSALDGDGPDNRVDCASADPTAARHHLCPASSRVHAPARPHRAAGHRAGNLRHRRYRSGQRIADLAAGALYARVGARGFWVMAALCALAFPLTWRLRQPLFGEKRTD